jgi:hypothetical protein
VTDADEYLNWTVSVGSTIVRRADASMTTTDTDPDRASFSIALQAVCDQVIQATNVIADTTCPAAPAKASALHGFDLIRAAEASTPSWHCQRVRETSTHAHQDFLAEAKASV